MICSVLFGCLALLVIQPVDYHPSAISTFPQCPSVFERIPLTTRAVAEFKPIAEGGFRFGQQNEVQLNYEAVTAVARGLGFPESVLLQVARMGRDGLRKPGSGICLSSVITRDVAVMLAKATPERSWTAWPGEKPTSFTCDPRYCPACKRVREKWGGKWQLIEQARNMSPAGLRGWPMLPDIWLDWYITIAERVPEKVICGGLFAQGAYVESLAQTYVWLPSNLRLTISHNLTMRPNSWYGVYQFSEWAKRLPRRAISAYDVIPREASLDQVIWFTDALRSMGYQGVILDR